MEAVIEDIRYAVRMLRKNPGFAAVAVINLAFAQAVFPGQDPIGKYIVNFGPLHDKIQVVGVVGNVRHVALETAPRPDPWVFGLVAVLLGGVALGANPLPAQRATKVEPSAALR